MVVEYPTEEMSQFLRPKRWRCVLGLPSPKVKDYRDRYKAKPNVVLSLPRRSKVVAAQQKTRTHTQATTTATIENTAQIKL